MSQLLFVMAHISNQIIILLAGTTEQTAVVNNILINGHHFKCPALEICVVVHYGFFYLNTMRVRQRQWMINIAVKYAIHFDIAAWRKTIGHLQRVLLKQKGVMSSSNAWKASLLIIECWVGIWMLLHVGTCSLLSVRDQRKQSGKDVM